MSAKEPWAPPGRKRKSMAQSTGTQIGLLDKDIMYFLFSYLDIFDVVRASAVCKAWNEIIKDSKLLEALYAKQRRILKSREYEHDHHLNRLLEELAMEHHCRSLTAGSVIVDQLKVHSLGVSECRMKMGIVVTGVGDKVIRLWSLNSYNCLEEYPVSSTRSLVDFDFDESKIVGLLGTQLCVWRRKGQKSIFPQQEGTFSRGLCMSYVDPEAVIGCEDGTVRIFDMYSRKCSRIFRIHAEPTTCLSFSDDQRLVSGSALGRISVCCLQSDHQVASLNPRISSGIKTLCFNPHQHKVFAGTTSGSVSCWDLRMMKLLWATRASSNVIYRVQHRQNDTLTLVAGGVDGVLRVLDQSTGAILARYVMSSGQSSHGLSMGRRLSEEDKVDQISTISRPPITCFAIGMNKVVTAHNGKYIRIWKFRH